MADYTAKFLSAVPPTMIVGNRVVDQHNANLVVLVEFSNGVRTSVRPILAANLDRDLRLQCIKAIRDLQAQDATMANLPAANSIINL